MKKSILHKDTFATKKTDTSAYLDSLMVNEQTLQVDEAFPAIAAGAARLGPHLMKFGRWVLPKLKKAGTTIVKNPWKSASATTAATVAATTIPEIPKVTSSVMQTLKNIAEKGADLTSSSTWQGMAVSAGLTAGAGLLLYKMYKDWLASRKDDEDDE